MLKTFIQDDITSFAINFTQLQKIQRRNQVMMRNCGVTVKGNSMGRSSKAVSLERKGCMLYFVRFITLSYFSCCH